MSRVVPSSDVPIEDEMEPAAPTVVADGLEGHDYQAINDGFLLEDVPTDPYDAIVVGSGATGGWAAMQLAEAGLRVLVLEAGRLLHPKTDFDVSGWTPEARRAQAERQPIQSLHKGYWRLNPKLFADDEKLPFSTPKDAPFAWIRGHQVGGRTLMWGGVALRLSDVEMRTRTLEDFGLDWPFPYSELAPYYAKVERLWQVRGSREGLAHFPDGDYLPPMPMTPGEVRFKQLLQQQWADRHLVMSRGLVDSAAVRSNMGVAYPAMSSPALMLVRAAKSGRARLRRNAIVTQVRVDANTRRACGVSFIDQKTRRSYEVNAKCVVLCASTLESTRILLNSAPGGLGNSSGALGRYLMDHPAQFFNGQVEAEQRGSWGGANSVYIPRFRNLPGKPRSAFRGGYGIWGGVGRATASAANMPDGIAPFVFVTVGEMLPRAENRMTLSREVDDWGMPVPHIECTYSDNEQRMAQDQLETMLEICQHTGLKAQQHKVELTVPGLYVHEVGTARMGRDPKESVLNPMNESWDVPGLFVTDGSCWPSSAYQNPTLTMAAVTARACDGIVEKFRRREL